MGKLKIKNLQRIKKINLNQWQDRLAKILNLLFLEKESVSFVLCDNKFIQKLNKEYFREDSSTDVIAFPLREERESLYLGEVIVSVEEVVNNSVIFKVSWEEELLRCLIHGILHLLGYKDRTKSEKTRMRRKEEEILSLVMEKN